MTPYTTTELLAIVEAEQRACVQGKRLSLRASQPTGNPAIDYFLDNSGIQSYQAFQDFKGAIQAYQREHQVSGVVWQTIALGDQHLTYPVVDDRLWALPADLQLLRDHRDHVVNFWRSGVRQWNLDLYQAHPRGKGYQPITQDDIRTIVQRSEWATLVLWSGQTLLEVILQLGWGQPCLATQSNATPQGGGNQIHAVLPGSQPLG